MMGSSEKHCQVRGFLTPPPKWKSNRCPPVMPRSERKPWSSVIDHQSKNDLFHVIHKVPAGDSPYVKAKHVQVIDRDPSRAVSMFWAAINAGDRVDSALKDMAIVMKQLDRSDEAIEAIKSFRDLCPLEAQESLDNILIELYKKSGRVEEEIQMLEDKIKNIEEGIAFDGKRTKMARSQGKKVKISIEKEYSRLLGNLAWALLQLEDYKSAEDAYRKALSLEPDKNKICNLAICLIHLNKMAEAKFLLHSVRASCKNHQMDESHIKSFERAAQILDDIEMQSNVKPMGREEGGVHGEVHTPFPLDSRSSKGFPTSINGDQNDPPGSERFLCSQDVRYDERQDAAFWQHGNENYTNFSVSRWRGYENQFGNGQHEGDFRNRAYVSPGSCAGTPRVPFTQPRKCLWRSKQDWKTNWIAEEAVGRCNRKLTFKQHEGCEDSHVVVAVHNSDTEFKSAGTKASACENWRKTLPEERTEASNEIPIKYLPQGNCKSNVMEIDELQNAANGQCNSEELVNGIIRSLKQVSFADVCFIDAAEKNNQMSTSLQKANTNWHGFSAKKKSWAEMVEEEDEQLLLSTGDDFPDENYNTNVAPETPAARKKPLPQNSNNQKVESSPGFKDDGYYTQPLHDTTSVINQATRKRSLSFDHHQNSSDTSVDCSDSPLQRRALDFEFVNAPSFKEDHATTLNGLNLMRRNRLQVFRNITPESPKY